MIPFMWEVATFRVGPDRMFRGVPCSVSLMEYVQVSADPNPFPPIHLWSRRRAT